MMIVLICETRKHAGLSWELFGVRPHRPTLTSVGWMLPVEPLFLGAGSKRPPE